MSEGSKPVAYIHASALKELREHKDATTTVSSGLLKSTFGNPMPLYASPSRTSSADMLAEALRPFAEYGRLALSGTHKDQEILGYFGQLGDVSITASDFYSAHKAIAVFDGGEGVAVDDRDQCDECGRRYGVVYSVPNDVWAKIAPHKETLGDYHEHQFGGMLCPDCAQVAAEKLGIKLQFIAAHSAGEVGVKVTPLEWTEFHASNSWYARGVGKIEYGILPVNDGGFRLFGLGDTSIEVNAFRSFGEAKAYAQADYEKRRKYCQIEKSAAEATLATQDS